MALTSVPPSGKNSFWYTSAVNSAMINYPFASWLVGSVCLADTRPPGGTSHARERHRDVVLATPAVGPLDQGNCQGEGIGVCGTEFCDERLDGARLRGVVP